MADLQSVSSLMTLFCVFGSTWRLLIVPLCSEDSMISKVFCSLTSSSNISFSFFLVSSPHVSSSASSLEAISMTSSLYFFACSIMVDASSSFLTDFTSDLRVTLSSITLTGSLITSFTTIFLTIFGEDFSLLLFSASTILAAVSFLFVLVFSIFVTLLEVTPPVKLLVFICSTLVLTLSSIFAICSHLTVACSIFLVACSILSSGSAYQ